MEARLTVLQSKFQERTATATQQNPDLKKIIIISSFSYTSQCIIVSCRILVSSLDPYIHTIFVIPLVLMAIIVLLSRKCALTSSSDIENSGHVALSSRKEVVSVRVLLFLFLILVMAVISRPLMKQANLRLQLLFAM